MDRFRQSGFWRSIVRQGYPDNDENRSLVMFNSLFLHVHPVKVKLNTIRITYTYGLGVIAAFLFFLLVITGGILMFFYIPSVDKAYLDMQLMGTSITFGMLLRNLHRWGAHLMVLVVFLHMCRVFFTGGYKKPREFNWALGVVLWVATLLFSFTGYLLPYDQLAYWAITIASNIAGYLPLIGSQAKYFLLGANTIGQDTLQRFYALHIFLLPAIMLVLIGVHFWRIRKDGGLSEPEEAQSDPPSDVAVQEAPADNPSGIFPARSDKTYGLMALMKRTTPMVDQGPDNSVFSWPNLLVAELLAILGTTVALLVLSFFVNAPLRAMANPNVTEDPAKAPWFFSSLQEVLLHMNPTMAGFFVPGLVILALMAIPYFDRERINIGVWFESKRGQMVCIASAVYTAVIEIGLVLFDALVPWQSLLGGNEIVNGWIVPILLIGALVFILYLGLRRAHSSKREIALGLFTAFVTTYFVLTISTQFFRGSGMHLIPFWKLPSGGLTF